MVAGVARYPMDLVAELVRMTDAVAPKPRHPKTYRKRPRNGEISKWGTTHRTHRACRLTGIASR